MMERKKKKKKMQRKEVLPHIFPSHCWFDGEFQG